jgi:hypothetical protein
MGELADGRHLAVLDNLLILLLQLLHGGGTGTAGALVARHVYFLDVREFSMGLSTTNIMMVVQLGLAMMPRGRSKASSALISGTTKGTSSSMRKALELSIITAPYLVMSSANSLLVPAPAEAKTMSTPLKSSLCCKSFTSYSLP